MMILPSYILALLTAFIIAMVGILVVRRSQLRCAQRREMRRQLIARFEGLPLPRLVQSAGINFTKYFYSVPLEHVHESIQICESCSSSQRCETELQKTEIDIAEIDFCPNKHHIDQRNK